MEERAVAGETFPVRQPAMPTVSSVTAFTIRITTIAISAQRVCGILHIDPIPGIDYQAVTQYVAKWEWDLLCILLELGARQLNGRVKLEYETRERYIPFKLQELPPSLAQSHTPDRRPDRNRTTDKRSMSALSHLSGLPEVGGERQ